MDNQANTEMTERLELIESMIAEGRRSSESWGWVFVLWGAAYYIAIAWATWGQGLSIWGDGRHWPAWPVTMLGTAALTLFIGLSGGHREPATALVRAVVSVWVCSGISMCFLFVAMSAAGRPAGQHLFVEVLAAMMGTTNGASGWILKWKMQIACGAIWWIASAAACFGGDAQVAAVLVAAVFLCQIVFGVYAMLLEARRRKLGAVAHA